MDIIIEHIFSITQPKGIPAADPMTITQAADAPETEYTQSATPPSLNSGQIALKQSSSYHKQAQSNHSSQPRGSFCWLSMSSLWWFTNSKPWYYAPSASQFWFWFNLINTVLPIRLIVIFSLHLHHLIRLMEDIGSRGRGHHQQLMTNKKCNVTIKCYRQGMLSNSVCILDCIQ
ncbi:uncharacterized protein [Rutidosis leptorrhynchoides]|uniref:uncharacterized protein n=1 Tax=Rutidosis leptorrhynchoides TaxID=125765 RepID=UPI003A9953E2